MSAILQLGDPRLRLVSKPVVASDPAVSSNFVELAEALQSFRVAHGWGRAISLPQLGLAKRIVAFDLGSAIVFAVNPVIDQLSTDMFELWDDCMCMPSIAVRVRRHRTLRLRFTSEHGTAQTWEQVPEPLAELVQHEIDHLNGILLTDRMLPEWGVIAREMRGHARPYETTDGLVSGIQELSL